MRITYWIVYGLGVLGLFLRVLLGAFAFCMQGVGTVTESDEVLMGRTGWYALALLAWIVVGPVLWRAIR